MATLKNTIINAPGYLTVPTVTTATRPTYPTVSFTNGYPVAVSANGLRLTIGSSTAYWGVYQNLPAYLTGLQCGTAVNITDSSTGTLSHAATVYMIRQPDWNAVDTTGWTSVETGKNYISGYTNLTVYSKSFAAGSFTYDDNSAMYLFDFSAAGTAAVKGQIEYNTTINAFENYDGLNWNTTLPVTSGLVMYLDAANFDCYSGWGTTARDLTGNQNNAFMVNSPGWTRTFGGTFTFNGSSNYMYVPTLNMSTGTSTIIGASRYNGATRGRIINGAYNNWLMGHWSATTLNYYAEGWVTAVAAGANDTTWRIYAATSDTVADSYNFYVNGALNAGPSTAGSAGPNGLAFGVYGNNNFASEYSTGDFSFCLAYNRVLSAAEIDQVYQYFRGRFGI